MVEIAICIAIIGFALVAIIGVLPLGLNVQKDNREDTIINQDGTFWLEAIRSGSRELTNLLNHVDVIRVTVPGMPPTTYNPPFAPADIIGLLSTPGTTNEAEVRAISGGLGEKGASTAAKEFTFAYLLRVEIFPYALQPPPVDPDAKALAKARAENLHELRLAFRWPLLPGGQLGRSRKTFRTHVSGRLVNDPDASAFFYFIPSEHR
jgi:hypothetical protein